MIRCATNQLKTGLCRNLSSSAILHKEKKKNADYGDDGLPIDYKLKRLRAGSRRLDTFVNRATGSSGSDVTKLIMQGKVRVNNEVYTKKSYNVCVDDVIEVWKQSYPENADLAIVDRSEIVNYDITPNGYDFEVKSWKKFISDNWRSSN
ncbi:unnamed protein product [Caenorhabditis bovis]|uniref:RNA-binding S4 domain-containing protein n=1 Tax=Caenorhabditis bovis TaxID=2654633 RepID=A0A8S1F9F0_9PELO|nr:unnamed protein product [Caenorhabditis bovis]